MIKVDDLDNIFVTADDHFGHKNIVEFCDRPFFSVDEMDQTLIDNWNSVVSENDTVWHLSDFTLGDFDQARKYFSQLNGKIFILANHWHHDKRWLPTNYFGKLSFPVKGSEPTRYIFPEDREFVPHSRFGQLNLESEADMAYSLRNVTIVPPMVVLEVEGMGNQGRPLAITLCHYPLAQWDRKHYGGWHLYGHTHKPDTSGLFRINVGVDCMNYYPVSLSGILQYMYALGW